MNNDRSLLRHTILNFITLLHFSVADAVPHQTKRQTLQEQLKIIGLLVGKEDLLLKKKKKVVAIPVLVARVLELVQLILEPSFKKQGIEMTVRPADLIYKGEARSLQEGLEQILVQVAVWAKKIDVSVDESKRVLRIRYDSEKKLPEVKLSPLDLLKKTSDHQRILFRTLMYLMEMDGIKLRFKPGSVDVKLPG